jgi:hypothetical protein
MSSKEPPRFRAGTYQYTSRTTTHAPNKSKIRKWVWYLRQIEVKKRAKGGSNARAKYPKHTQPVQQGKCSDDVTGLYEVLEGGTTVC